MITIPKKFDLQQSSYYRNITLLTTASKVCNSLLLNCISKHLEPILSRNRNDVYRVRSNLPQRLVLRRIIEKSNIGNRQASIIFFDFSKVFDSVNRYAIFHTLPLPPCFLVKVVDQAFQIALDPIKNHGLTLQKWELSRHPSMYATDPYYLNDIALLADQINNAKR